MSSALARKAEAWARACDAFVASTASRAADLAALSSRLGGEVTPTPPPAPQATTTPWASSVDDVSDRIEALEAQARAGPRLERLVALGEAAVEALERALDEAEALAALQRGYDKDAALRMVAAAPPPPPHQTRRQGNSRLLPPRNAENDSLMDEEEPPTPPRMLAPQFTTT